jgi:hypothetical protein
LYCASKCAGGSRKTDAKASGLAFIDKVKPIARDYRHLIALHSPSEEPETGLLSALAEKTAGNASKRAQEVRFLQSGVTKKARNSALFTRFRANLSWR